MLLEDLINTKIKNKIVNKKLKPPKTNNLLSDDGLFSTVKTDSSDPHMIKKTVIEPTRDIEENVHWLYIRKIVESGIADSNPYFPRIYNITSIKGLRDEELRRATMEKLIPYTDFSKSTADPQLGIVYQKMGGAEHVKVSVDHIVDTLNYNLLNQQLDRIQDPQYKEALDFIKNIYNENSAIRYDIHEGNIMFRRGPSGLQLVITDPFYGIIA